MDISSLANPQSAFVSLIQYTALILWLWHISSHLDRIERKIDLYKE